MKYIIVVLIFTNFLMSMSKDKVAKGIKSELDKMKNVIIEFEQVQFWELAGEQSSEFGVVKFVDVQKYKIEMDGNYIIFNNGTVFRYSKENNQILIEKIESNDTSALDIRLLFQLEESFEIFDFNELEDEIKVNLKPKKHGENMILELNLLLSDKFEAKEMEILDIDDNKTIYKIIKIDKKQVFDDNEFNFKDNGKVEVMDLR
ncbi:MAG: outer-membrane lipoprotein carrier protein LolA [Candidatus Delongbacteria bacterium]|nr:outer-membrane lipoprotein carrier protein LolA [Candidatus Delongbacteria bacterium]MBN2835021.1 outer-membrane lipoprotein carrier protein LolA [Candidatus Delongbacteria bacterium]